LKIAYIVSRFPKITETFVLYEILELKRQGVEVEIFPLLRERTRVTHPGYEQLLPNTHHRPLLAPKDLAVNLVQLFRRPGAYLGTLFLVLWRTLGSLNFFFGTLGFWLRAVQMAGEMKKLGITHVHAHFCNHPAMCAFIVHRLTGIPYSFTAHGSDLHVDQRALDLKIRFSAFSRMISRYNVDFVVGRLGRSFGDKLRVIRCGVDPEVFTPRNGKAGPCFRILCVASFREVKGHRHLVEACALLRDRGIEFVCHLVGEGPTRGRVERRIREAELEDRVQILGALPRQQVIENMRAADVVVLPSVQDSKGRREGIPVTLMEAMACAVSVVASDLSGIPELISSGESGLLVPPGDPSVLAQALERLVRSPEERRRLGAGGRAAVLREFDLRVNSRQLVEAIRSVSQE